MQSGAEFLPMRPWLKRWQHRLVIHARTERDPLRHRPRGNIASRANSISLVFLAKETGLKCGHTSPFADTASRGMLTSQPINTSLRKPAQFYRHSTVHTIAPTPAAGTGGQPALQARQRTNLLPHPCPTYSSPASRNIRFPTKPFARSPAVHAFLPGSCT